MPFPVTSLVLHRALSTNCGYPTHRGSGGHLIRPVTFNTWVGVASADFTESMRPYRTTDNWNTVTLEADFPETASANIVTAMYRNGVVIIIGAADRPLPPSQDYAGMETSQDTGQSYSLATMDTYVVDPNLGTDDGNFRAYAIIRRFDLTYVAGMGQGRAALWTSTDLATWTNLGTFVAFDPILEEYPQRTVMALLELFGGDILAITTTTLNPATGRMRIYKITDLDMLTATIVWDSVTASVSTSGVRASLFEAISGTLFAVRGVILRSTDGGDTWTPISGTSTAVGQMAEIFGTLCVPGAGASVLHSIDDGLTWTILVGSGATECHECWKGNDNKFYVSGYGTGSQPVILATNVIQPPAPTRKTYGGGMHFPGPPVRVRPDSRPGSANNPFGYEATTKFNRPLRRRG